jgi:mannitol-specific phosphotransferase system IIBC component
MFLTNHKLKFILAVLVMFAVGYICSSDKDDKKDDTKKENTKEDTKKEDTKKEDTKKEETTSSSSDVKLYFCEEYTDGKEIGRLYYWIKRRIFYMYD